MNPFQGLGISCVPSKYVCALPSKDGSFLSEKRFLLAAHINWIRELVSTKQIPSTFPLHDQLQEDEIQAFITQGKFGPFGPNWMFLLVTILKSPKCTQSFESLDGTSRTKLIRPKGKMTWPQIVDFIGECNFNYIWEQPQINLLGNDRPCSLKSENNKSSYAQVETQVYVNKLLKYIYINLDKDEDGNKKEDDYLETERRFPVSNLSQALSITSISSQDDEFEHFLIFHQFVPFSLHDAVTFSPQKLVSTSRQMFLAYQILQFLRDFEAIDLPLGDLSLKDFKIDECLYLNVIPWISQIVEKLKTLEPQPQSVNADPSVLVKVKFIVNKVRGWDNSSNELVDCRFNPKLIESVIRHWCEGWIPNYDYLMFLNFLCGRFCNGNPNFQPVFPWISDLSSPMGGWRDFTKSKFRLNKGDRQLDIMYDEATGMTEKTVPHHVTDILSEITYYVYKARKTPKEVLCKFVRPKWVPNEYPGSIARMQDWTPDECIPEFFDDASIFKSIHEDLPDLQVPKWCSSPEEFINHHRRMLESDLVSAKLHHWIDLTFGYKLSGQAAVKSKNIYLALADSHQNLESHGVVQLFQTAHPPKRNPFRDLRNMVTFKDLKKLREQESEEPTQEVDPKSKAWKNITLPKHYDPMGFLNDFEVTVNFFKTHFPYLKDTNVKITGIKDRQALSNYVKLFGCLLLEMVLPQKCRHSSGVTFFEDKFNFYTDIVKTCSTLIPLYCRRALQAIFDRDSLEFSIPVDISLDLLLLGDKLGPIPFPFYFADIYKMLKSIRNYEKVLATSAPDDFGYRQRVQELKVQSFSRDLIQLLASLDNEGVDLVLPFVIEMFENSETRVLAVWNLFCPFAKAIGRKKAAEFLLQPIIQIYETDYHSDKHLKLFHKTFLLQLCNCFGLRTFLDHFSTLLIEAIGGWKISSDPNDITLRAHLNSTALEMDEVDDSSVLSKEKSLLWSTTTAKNSSQFLKRSESEANDTQSSQPIEPEMFVMEPDFSDSESNESGGQAANLTNLSTDATVNASFSSVFVNEPRLVIGPSGSSRNQSQSPHNQSTRITRNQQRGTSATRSSSTSSAGGGSSKSVIDISDVCFESIISLAHRLGPVLTAKYFSRNLLRMLTLCYLDHLDYIESSKVGVLMCEGDIHAAKVLECLVAISDLYGDSFVERQYTSYCIEIIKSIKQKLSPTAESALIGASTVLVRIFQLIPDALLMTQLQDPIIKDILSPLVNFICSPASEFPSGAIPRAILASKCMSMINSIRKKIGPDLSQVHLKPIVFVICKTFVEVYNSNGTAKADMSSAFDSQLASQIFTNFCDVITGSEFEGLIRDLYLQQGLSERSVAIRDEGSPTSEKSQQKRLVEQQSSFGSRSFGNRIQVQELETTAEEHDSTPATRKDPTRHLRGNWLVYWDHEIGRSDSKFNFKQIKLQTFTGHTGSVRYIYALDNENSFLTASKDRTVKLFSLRNQGDENVVCSCQWTYSNHKKTVLSVLFHEPLHLAASTDGTIHIWDPFVGKLVRILEKEKGTTKTSQVCALRPILHTSNFVGAGIDSSLHVIDCRTCNAYELKIGIGQASGLVRCLAVADNGQMAMVGHSSGMLSTLDLRNGTLLGSWKGHDGEVLQLVPHKKQLISSSFDQNISVWNMDENKLAFNMRGPTEPVHSMCTYESELLSCTTSNRIGIHNGIDGNSDFSSTRLRSDTFKGVVTSMRLLPLNQFLLLGSDSGNIVLLC